MDEQRPARVLTGPRKAHGSDEQVLGLFDRERYEPIEVRVESDGPAGGLRPGYLLDVDLRWAEPQPHLEDFTLRRPTLYAFADDIDPVFEVARDLWEETRASGDSMNSRLTRNTDNEVNGVCYVFADSGSADRLQEFEDGSRPLEPLVDRVNESDEPASREAFVLRPADGAFVVVTIALEKGGHFAETLRETYDLDRPAEPLV